MPKTITRDQIEAAARRDRERHETDDAQFLADDLFSKAEKADPRARRLIVRLYRTLVREMGATFPPATWPALTSPEREAEARALVADQS